MLSKLSIILIISFNFPKQSRIKSIFNVVISPPRQEFRYLAPLIPKYFMSIYNFLIFFFCPFFFDCDNVVPCTCAYSVLGVHNSHCNSGSLHDW